MSAPPELRRGVREPRRGGPPGRGPPASRELPGRCTERSGATR